MTRKDYVMLAECFARECSEPGKAAQLKGIACAIADALARENPRFDRARFLKACGID